MHCLPYDERTLRFYAEEAPIYAGSGAGGVSRHLHAFLDRLPAGVRILELGCGGGRDAEAMLERGYKVDPTDGVAQMADKARQRIGVPVRVMRFDELAAVEEYEAVWANATAARAHARIAHDFKPHPSRDETRRAPLRQLQERWAGWSGQF